MKGFIPIQLLYIVIAVSLASLVIFIGTGIITENNREKQDENETMGTEEPEVQGVSSDFDTTIESTSNIIETSESAPTAELNQSQNSQSALNGEAENVESSVSVEFDAGDVEKQLANNTSAAPTTEAQAETTPEPSSSPLTFSDINISTREAMVNIFCTTKGGGPFSPTSGSGIIIDERGVILTNAHIAQYFLLRDHPSKDFIDCIIRVGSPAQPRYRASLLFISPDWIEANAEKIIQQNPLGNGENDYAFLLINEPIRTGAKLPDTFSSANPVLDETVIKKGEDVLIAGYPAGFLGGIAIQKDLYITSTITDIEGIFTFKENTLDLFSLGGSIVAQQGASGGAVVTKENGLIGIIVTSSDGDTTDERDLRAITLSHINRSLILNSEITLKELLEGDLLQKTLDFSSSTAPALTKLLVDVLE